MSYRKSKPTSEQKAAAKWLESHRTELESLGLPPAVLSSASAWDDFLETGAVYQPYEFIFYEHLLPEQMRLLHRFLEREYGRSQRKPGLLGFLRERAYSSGASCV